MTFNILREQTHTYQNGEPFGIQLVSPPAAQVELISWSTLPRNAMYLTTRGYTGVYSSKLGGEYTQEQAFEDIVKTKLQTPFEMVHTLWLLTGVTRAFTHQLVRYRIGTAFVQESMRFFGKRKTFRILATGRLAKELNLEAYWEAAKTSVLSYVDLLENSVPDQDARGVLPTNILTNIFFDCSLRTLSNIIPQRLCCQAQPGEWQYILKFMRNLISETLGPEIEQLLRAPYERGQPCGYRASFDRPCTWRHK